MGWSLGAGKCSGIVAKTSSYWSQYQSHQKLLLGRDATTASNIDILTDIKGNLFAASETLYLDNVTIDGNAKLSF